MPAMGRLSSIRRPPRTCLAALGEWGIIKATRFLFQEDTMPGAGGKRGPEGEAADGGAGRKGKREEGPCATRRLGAWTA